MVNGWLMELFPFFQSLPINEPRGIIWHGLVRSLRGRKKSLLSNYSRILGFPDNLETLEMSEWLP